MARWRGLLTEQDRPWLFNLPGSGRFREPRHRRFGKEAGDRPLAWVEEDLRRRVPRPGARLLQLPIATFDHRVAGAAERFRIPLHTLE